MGTKDFNILDKVIAKLRLNKILKYFRNEDVVLDLGCGYQAYLLKNIKNRIVEGIGIDYEVENSEFENIRLIKYKYRNKLPFNSQYFDKVVMMAVIEHFDEFDAETLLKEILRVLKVKGILIITTPTPMGERILEFMANRLHIVSTKEIGDHKKYYSYNDLMRLGKKIGFKISEYRLFQFGINSLAVLETL